jgi:Putative polyhydroxyalkanoic acid system protein (PHA_gran_rgn)
VTEPVTISIPHRLGKEAAVARLKEGLASANLPLVSIEHEVWTGDRLDFSLSGMGQKATGSVLVREDSVQISLILPWMLQRIAEIASNALASRAKLLLEKK